MTEQRCPKCEGAFTRKGKDFIEFDCLSSFEKAGFHESIECKQRQTIIESAYNRGVQDERARQVKEKKDETEMY